ncbi:MAG: hypothetical protein WD556_13625 [Actinomycetota bacterium]
MDGLDANTVFSVVAVGVFSLLSVLLTARVQRRIAADERGAAANERQAARQLASLDEFESTHDEIERKMLAEAGSVMMEQLKEMEPSPAERLNRLLEERRLQTLAARVGDPELVKLAQRWEGVGLFGDHQDAEDRKRRVDLSSELGLAIRDRCLKLRGGNQA